MGHDGTGLIHAARGSPARGSPSDREVVPAISGEVVPVVLVAPAH